MAPNGFMQHDCSNDAVAGPRGRGHEVAPAGVKPGRFAAWCAALRRLGGQRRAGTSIEFAIVMPAFLVLMGMILENGMLLFDQAFLDYATFDAARLIRTGQVQKDEATSPGSGKTAFYNLLCNDVSSLIDCTALQYNVQSAANPGFSSLSSTVVMNSSGIMTTTSFTPGGPGDDVLVQVMYKRAYLVPLVYIWSGAPSFMVVFATTAFQTEKYSGQ